MLFVSTWVYPGGTEFGNQIEIAPTLFFRPPIAEKSAAEKKGWGWVRCWFSNFVPTGTGPVENGRVVWCVAGFQISFPPARGRWKTGAWFGALLVFKFRSHRHGAGGKRARGLVRSWFPNFVPTGTGPVENGSVLELQADTLLDIEDGKVGGDLFYLAGHEAFDLSGFFQFHNAGDDLFRFGQ